jgi:serine/threonine protein kinase
VNDEFDACITDFGLSRILEVSGFTTKSVGGTCRWMAYELIAYEFHRNPTPKVTADTDIWAFGMTVLEVGSSVMHFLSV